MEKRWVLSVDTRAKAIFADPNLALKYIEAEFVLLKPKQLTKLSKWDYENATLELEINGADIEFDLDEVPCY